MLYRDQFKEMSKDNMSLEELFVIVYCVIDDYYMLLFGSQAYFRRSPNNNPPFTDAELITIALVGELKGYNSERAWWRFVSKNYRSHFPRLCDRTRYGRRLRKLKVGMEQIRHQLLFQLDVSYDRTRIVDSFPLRLLRLPRLSGSSCPFEYAAGIGYCPSLKESYYGFKFHLLTDVRGIPVAFVLTPAFPHDSQGFLHLLDELITLGMHHLTIMVVGDKAYVGTEYARTNQSHVWNRTVGHSTTL